MPDDTPESSVHPASLPAEILLEDCDIRRSRASGPGGQHRNKVETAIEITHRPTGIKSMAVERRSQEENRRVAVDRLRMNLAVQLRNVDSEIVEPSDMWVSRCRNSKIACNEKHRDFPAMIAEALDAADAKSYDVKKAAAALGCSTSQLVRFIAKVPEAMQALNTERTKLGLRTLKP